MGIPRAALPSLMLRAHVHPLAPAPSDNLRPISSDSVSARVRSSTANRPAPRPGSQIIRAVARFTFPNLSVAFPL